MKTIMNFTVRALEGATADAFIASSWAELYRQDPEATPYQSPSWLTGWAQQLPPTARPVVAVCEDPARQVLAALALVHDHEGTRVRTYALSTPMGEYTRAVGPAAEHPQVSAFFARYLEDLAHKGHHVELAGLPTTGTLARHLTPTDTSPTGLWHTSVTDCAEIALPLAYEEMSRSTRRDHKRRQRTWDELAQSHEVIYHRTRDSDELITAYAVLTRLHARRWAGHTPPPGSPHTPDAPHWQAVLQQCGPDTAFIATLALDTEVVAAQLCLTRHRRAYSVVPALHPHYKELAPGHALLRHLAQDLTTVGFEYLDLGRTVPGQHAYKNQYRPRWSETVSVVSAPPRACMSVPDELAQPSPELV
ncbi:GNAT family N-acetyltransferase [Streptomyces altiplanensis]